MSRITTFAEQELGVTLTPGQQRAVTEFEEGSYQQAVWRWGRRSGKSLMADVLVVADAILRDDLRKKMRPKEPRISAIVAPRLEQASAHILNIAGLVDHSPRLSRLVVSQSSESIVFKNGSVIQAFPCSARSLRGGAWSSVVLDELGHFITSDDGPAAGDRILEAALPSLAQFGGAGWLVAISTPLWRSGAFYKLCERAESGKFPYIHGLHASTADMNPAISAEWLDARRLEDPELYSREFEATWIDGATSYLSSTDVMGCVRDGGALAPASEYDYKAALDVAYHRDSTALVIAHKERDLLVVDGCWTWRKAGHEAMLGEVAAMLARYRIRRVRIDQFAEVAVRETLAHHSVEVDYQPWTNTSKADSFGRLKALINTRGISLPQDSALIEELVRLEARPTPSGATRIAAAGSGHDDRATALASLAEEAQGRRGDVMVWGNGGGYIPGVGEFDYDEDGTLVRADGRWEPPAGFVELGLASEGSER